MGRVGKVVSIVIAEYILLVALFLLLVRFLSPTPGQVGSLAAILFGILSLANFFIASRMFRNPFGGTATDHLRMLREEFLYLRFYFDDILETMSSGILVLDRLLTVRSMNHAERHLLALREKEELIGKAFRYHPLSQQIYTGEIYNYRGKPLLEILEHCVREGSSILIEGIRYATGPDEEAHPIDILVYPWKNRNDETERLVIRMDDRQSPAPAGHEIDLEKLIASRPAELEERSTSFADSVGLALREDCETAKDHLEALLESSRSIHEILDPSENGKHAELLLFEMQVRKIIDIIRSMEKELGKSLS